MGRGPIAQLVASLTADPRVVSSIPAHSHTSVENDCEFVYGLSPSSTDSRRVVVKQKYVQEELVKRICKFAQEKVWLGELTISTWP